MDQIKSENSAVKTIPFLFSRWWMILTVCIATTGLLAVFFHSALNGTNIEADFFTFWMAGRQFFFERQNPYSPEVALQTQYQLYGRSAQGNEDRLGYSYPVYNLLPLFPFFTVEFSWAASAWLALNFIILIATVFLLSKAPPRTVLVTLPFLYPFSFCLLLGNFPILLAAIVITFYSTFIQKNVHSKPVQILFGLLLAWATSKPQFLWLHMVFILLFAYRERLWSLLVSFVSAMAGMLAFTLVWLPGWPLMWFNQLSAYTGYHQYKTELVLFSIMDSFLPRPWSTTAATILLVIFLFIAIWTLYAWWRNRLDPIAVMAWSGFVMYAMDPYGLSYAQITFWIPVVIWAVTRKGKNAWFAIFWMANIVLSWVLFAVGIHYGIKASTRDWPLLVYLPWVVWFLLQKITGFRLVFEKEAFLHARSAEIPKEQDS